MSRRGCLKVPGVRNCRSAVFRSARLVRSFFPRRHKSSVVRCYHGRPRLSIVGKVGKPSPHRLLFFGGEWYNGGSHRVGCGRQASGRSSKQAYTRGDPLRRRGGLGRDESRSTCAHLGDTPMSAPCTGRMPDSRDVHPPEPRETRPGHPPRRGSLPALALQNMR